MRYQNRLQQNLMYLAAIADRQPQMATQLAQGPSLHAARAPVRTTSPSSLTPTATTQGVSYSSSHHGPLPSHNTATTASVGQTLQPQILPSQQTQLAVPMVPVSHSPQLGVHQQSIGHHIGGQLVAGASQSIVQSSPNVSPQVSPLVGLSSSINSAVEAAKQIMVGACQNTAVAVSTGGQGPQPTATSLTFKAAQDVVMVSKPTDSANPIATSGFLEGIDAAAVQAMKRPRIEGHQHGNSG